MGLVSLITDSICTCEQESEVIPMIGEAATQLDTVIKKIMNEAKEA